MFLKCEILSKWSIAYFTSILHTLCSLTNKKLLCLGNIQNKITLKSYKKHYLFTSQERSLFSYSQREKMQQILQNITDLLET